MTSTEQDIRYQQVSNEVHNRDRRAATVLVVGAGPVGLTLACELAWRGVGVLIIDAQAEPSRHSKAIGVFPFAHLNCLRIKAYQTRWFNAVWRSTASWYTQKVGALRKLMQNALIAITTLFLLWNKVKRNGF